MAGVRINDRGVYPVPRPNDFKVSIPTKFDMKAEFQASGTLESGGDPLAANFSGSVAFFGPETGTAITVSTGSFRVSQGQTELIRVSGSNERSGFLKLGGVPLVASNKETLLMISASADQSGLNAITIFSTGSGNGGGQGNGQGGKVNGSGGNIGVHQSPSAGSLMLFTDGVQLFVKNSAGTQFVLIATSSAGVTM